MRVEVITDLVLLHLMLHDKDRKPPIIKEWLEAKGDPQKQFLTTLLDSMPEYACVLTWNRGFEGKVLRALSEQFPKYHKRIHAIIDNMVDLMVPFRSKQIYHWQFDGSYSIKAVLPALVPELSYETLAIGDGGTAADSWLKMRSSSDRDEQDQIRQNLLEYCHLDTLAMVRIVDKMKELAISKKCSDQSICRLV